MVWFAPILFSLYAAKYTLCNQSSEIYAQRELIESFKTHNWMPMNNSALRKEIHDMEIRNSNVLELRMENLLNELEDQFEQIIDKHIEAVIYESNKDKILRAKKRHQYLDNIANVISDGLMNAECLWILMQIDLGRVKKRQSIDELIENYTMEAKLSRKRFVCKMWCTSKPIGYIQTISLSTGYIAEKNELG